jgi:parvulin-like peptidyl-prolyl isomerase
MGARQWTLGGLAGAALLGCVTGQAQAQGQQPPPARTAPAANPTGRVAAVVNGEEITMAELEAVLKRQPQEPAPLPEAKRVAIRRIALATLIDDMLRHQFLRKMTLPVSKAEIDKKMAEMAEAVKAQGKTLDDFYKDTGETPEGLRTAIGYQLQWVAYCNTVATDEVLFKYYNANKDVFDGVMVEVSHIVLRVPPEAPPAEIAKAKATLAQMRKDILDKKIDFAQAARQYSQCESAPRGGVIGAISRRSIIDEAFAQASFALQVGQVSDVVQSSYGVHLIKVTDRNPGKPSEFAKVKENVRMMYLNDLDDQILQEMRKTAKIQAFID